MMIPRFGLGVVLLLCSIARAGLQADELLLITNKNVPAGKALAEFYAQARGVPAGRIVSLDLPQGDEISFDAYERSVVPALRQALSAGGLDQKVRCLVTFFGVPLRISGRVATTAERDEVQAINKELAVVKPQVVAAVQDLEAQAATLDAGFAPKVVADDPDALGQRADMAIRAMVRSLNAAKDPAKAQEAGERVKTVLAKLAGKGSALENLARSPASTQQAEAQDQIRQLQHDAQELQSSRFDPAARKKLREFNAEWTGLLGQVRVLTQQADYLSATETMAAVDNELPLLWWQAYPRGRWLGNPLHWRVSGRLPFPTLMVMRLDAPTDKIVQQLIESSLATEKAGLTGPILIDAGGAKKLDPSMKKPGYWQFEHLLGDLRDLLKKHNNLELIYDDAPAIVPPGTASGVALYCGWYQLRDYRPGFTLARGAVGYHVASYELASLHNPGEKGWVAGLLKDGICGTVGPVSEPYLSAFPPPDEFFPLLLTGKLTLAEVFWKTEPSTSWMMSMIGDPLYVPYLHAPGLKAEDLPEKLRPAIK